MSQELEGLLQEPSGRTLESREREISYSVSNFKVISFGKTRSYFVDWFLVSLFQAVR